MRRWIAALAAEQIGNNQTLFQDPALWYWNGFHRCKANITLRSSPIVCSQPAVRRSCSRMRGCICLAAWYGNIALLPSWGQPREFGWDHHGRENHLQMSHYVIWLDPFRLSGHNNSIKTLLRGATWLTFPARTLPKQWGLLYVGFSRCANGEKFRSGQGGAHLDDSRRRTSFEFCRKEEAPAHWGL